MWAPPNHEQPAPEAAWDVPGYAQRELKHLPTNIQLSCRRAAADSNSWNKLLVGLLFFLKGILMYQWWVRFPLNSPCSLSLLPTVREFSSINIMKLLLCLAGKHVPTTGKPENRFSSFFFFFLSRSARTCKISQGLLSFYKEINCNTELQEMKVIALTFQLANEDTVQML